MAIGDLSSEARGTGARFNDGKVALDLLPLRVLAALLRTEYGTRPEVDVMACLGSFQEGNDNAIKQAMFLMGPIQETVTECAQVFDYGRKKYAEWNWAKGMAWSVPIGCASRHLMAMLSGELIDPVEKKGSGLPHRGHVMCNLVMLETYRSNFQQGDDRPRTGDEFLLMQKPHPAFSIAPHPGIMPASYGGTELLRSKSDDDGLGTEYAIREPQVSGGSPERKQA